MWSLPTSSTCKKIHIQNRKYLINHAIEFLQQIMIFQLVQPLVSQNWMWVKTKKGQNEVSVRTYYALLLKPPN